VAADNLAREIREANSSYREKTAFTPYDPTPSSDASGVTAAFANIPHAAEDAYHYFRSLFASADKADSQPVAQAPEINANQNTAADSPGRVSGSPSSPDASVRDFSHYKSRMDRRRETLKNDHAKDLPLAAAEPQPSENTPTPNPTKCRQEAAQARKDLIDKGVTPAQAESTITKDLEAAKTDPHRFPNCRKYFGHSAPSV
jgi:hypothetical protein